MQTPVCLMPSPTSLQAFLTLKPARRIASMKLDADGSTMNRGRSGSPSTNAAMSST